MCLDQICLLSSHKVSQGRYGPDLALKNVSTLSEAVYCVLRDVSGRNRSRSSAFWRTFMIASRNFHLRSPCFWQLSKNAAAKLQVSCKLSLLTMLNAWWYRNAFGIRLMAARTPETNKELQNDCRKESPPAAIWPTTFCVAVDADAIGDENL